MNEPTVTKKTLFDFTDNILKKNYLSELSEKEVLPYSEKMPDAQEINKSVRFFDITQIVLNKNENMRDKLITVFNAVGNTGASLLFQLKGTKDSVEIRLGIKNSDENLHTTALAQNVLKGSLESNFPGTHISELPLSANDLKSKIIDEFSATKTVATITDVAGLRTEEETKDKQFMQGIEKFVDAMRGRQYMLLLIADPVSLSDLNKSRRALEDIYTSLMPFSESQYSVGKNESNAVSYSIGTSFSETTSKSIAESVNHTVGKSHTQTKGASHTETVGSSTSITDGTSKTRNINPAGIGSLLGGLAGFALGGPIGIVIGGAIGGRVGGTVSFSSGKNHSVTNGTSHSDAYGTSESNSYGTSTSDSQGKTTTESKAQTTGRTETDGKQHSEEKSTNLQIKFENHAVKQLMNRIDKTLERYDMCADLGMWNCAVYCIGDKATAEMMASIYRSIIRGKNSSLEASSITVWNTEKTPDIMTALRHFEHPLLNIDGLNVTPGTLISSAELAIEAGLPNHSVPGIPVIECAEFGRTVSPYDNICTGRTVRSVPLGKIFNMNHEENLSVELNADSLSSHTFITGSTGSGKSNTVYHILNQLPKIGVKYLVVEPAKGEYKTIFGNAPAVSVYGTNPALTPLLRINPFSFPNGYADASKNIHILEHLDRLVEIFNVCWPMYAAMPAVLKEAVEKSYEDCGWNLAESTNEYGENLYPTFADVARNIRAIIDNSEYDSENKGAYKGSLITRLKSLTNGINGLIFTADEISNEDLFDKNVIVDLSRVGSSETKSLIMGLLILKLQEYRMTSSGMNSDLRHVTVLEEAHNLLKRTSTEQSQDSGNLLGKSVEMLANSIAEMRTYGEGFIIADQAPGLLDLAAIRNTNTKIIMRLPDHSDRELVGKAANLNDDQIAELAKLPCGVAAVYQNEWIEPVLCKIAKADVAEDTYKYSAESEIEHPDTTKQRLNIAKLLFSKNRIGNESYEKDLKELGLCASSEVAIRKCLINPPESPRFTKIAPIVAELFPEVYENFKKIYGTTSDVKAWTDGIDAAIKQIDIQIETENLRNIRQCIITQLVYNEMHDEKTLEKWSKEAVK